VPGLVRWLGSGSCQAGFVGKDDGLKTVAQVELGQYPADVDLHGARGQVQAGGDLGIGQADGDESEDVLLTAGEGSADLLGWPAAGLLGGLGGELPDEAPGGAGRLQASAGGTDHPLAAGRRYLRALLPDETADFQPSDVEPG
jgi:hypothetical protein